MIKKRWATNIICTRRGFGGLAGEPDRHLVCRKNGSQQRTLGSIDCCHERERGCRNNGGRGSRLHPKRYSNVQRHAQLGNHRGVRPVRRAGETQTLGREFPLSSRAVKWNVVPLPSLLSSCPVLLRPGLQDRLKTCLV